MPIALNGTTFSNGGTATYNGTSLNEIQFSGTTVWKKETPISTVLSASGSGSVGDGSTGSASITSSNSWDLRNATSVSFYFDTGSYNIPAGPYWQATSVMYYEYLVFADNSTIIFASGDYGNGTQPRSGTRTVDLSNKTSAQLASVKFRQYYSWSSNGQNTNAAWYMSAQLRDCVAT